MLEAAEDISEEDLHTFPRPREKALTKLRYHICTMALLEDLNARTWSTAAMPPLAGCHLGHTG